MKKAVAFLVLFFSTNMVANDLAKQLKQLEKKASEKMFDVYINPDQQGHWQGVSNTVLMICCALGSGIKVPIKTLKSLQDLLATTNNFEPSVLYLKLDAIEHAIPLE